MRWLRTLRGFKSAFGAGILLVLVPTLFSIFPSWTHWSIGVRILVVVGWFLAACYAVSSASRQSSQVDDLVGEATERRDEARVAAAEQVLRALLQPATLGLPGHYEVRLFIPNGEGVLLAEYESEGSDGSHGWSPGQGGVGTAQSTNGLIVVPRQHIADGTYNLTPAQQARYRDLEIVAAHPVQNARGQAIGVLAISSTTDDGHFRGTPGQLELVALSEVVARVLIDILQLEHD